MPSSSVPKPQGAPGSQDRQPSAPENFQQVYEHLREMARSYMQRERPDHTLQPTALIHEAYLRIAQRENETWQSRAHFLAVAAQAMRRILVDHARGKARLKRGGLYERQPLEGLTLGPDSGGPELVHLDEALTRLAGINPQHAQIVELRFFGGMTVKETAEALDISASSVERAWRAARAWLFREMSAEDDS